MKRLCLILMLAACPATNGRFCGTFSAAPARTFMSAQVFAPARPARGSAPLACPAEALAKAEPATHTLPARMTILIYP